MIEKDKTYTGEEIEKMIREAQLEIMSREEEQLSKDVEEAEDKEHGMLVKIMMTMHTITNLGMLNQILFGEE